MAITDYDYIIGMVEENITLETSQVQALISRMLGKTQRKVSELFQNFDPDDRTLLKYIVDRKTRKALQDYVNVKGMTQEAVAEKYNLSDVSHFGDNVQKICEGNTLKMMREKGYVCPEPLYSRDLFGIELDDIVKNSSMIGDYKREMTELIEENNNLRNELSAEKKKQYKDHPEQDIFTYSNYKEFLELEELRVIYDLDVSTLLKLRNISIKSGEKLTSLCMKELEKNLYETTKDSDFELDRLGYRLAYEKDLSESWDYYYGDDEVDDRESQREENIYSDVEVIEYEDAYIGETDYLDYAEEGEIKDNAPDDKQIEAWLQEKEDKESEQTVNITKQNETSGRIESEDDIPF